MTQYLSRLLHQTGLQFAATSVEGSTAPPAIINTGEGADTNAPLELDMQHTIEPQVQRSAGETAHGNVPTSDTSAVVSQVTAGTPTVGEQVDQSPLDDARSEVSRHTAAIESTDTAEDVGPSATLLRDPETRVREGALDEGARRPQAEFEPPTVTLDHDEHSQKRALDEGVRRPQAEFEPPTITLGHDEHSQKRAQPVIDRPPASPGGDDARLDAPTMRPRPTTLDEARAWVGAESDAADGEITVAHTERQEDVDGPRVTPQPAGAPEYRSVGERQQETQTSPPETQDLYDTDHTGRAEADRCSGIA
jgi:hypothetical protein